jgi:plastocyanin
VLRRFKIVIVVGIMATLALSACGGTGGGGGGGAVDVTLQDWSVIPAQDSVEAGSVTFNVTNEGPHPHEFVVIRTDLAPDALPTMPEGMVDEEGEGIEVIGEIEEFPRGETRSATFDLDPGSYVLVCNLVGNPVTHPGGEIHYEMGMRTAFTVE